MNNQAILDTTVVYVKQTLANAEGGHDWWHIYRVWKNAEQIAKEEKGVNGFIVALGALLHDIADSKFHGGNEEIGPQMTREFLQAQDVDELVIEQVVNIVRHISFKGGAKAQPVTTPELAVVQDADRLDAMGAIGIARAFSFGGHKGRALYDPNIPPNLQMTKEEYKNSNAPTINHFYEKLLRLKGLMNTESGRSMAEERHKFMEQFLEQFFSEVGGGLKDIQFRRSISL